MINSSVDLRAVPELWPEEGLESVSVCPVCRSGRRHILYTQLVDRVFRCAPGQWDLYECEGCQSAYLDPRPTPGTIHVAYEVYYTHERPVSRPSGELSGIRRSVRALANGYRNKRFNGNLKPANRLGAYVIPLMPKYRHAIDRGLRYLPPRKDDGRLLDIGFGKGDFIYLAKRIGWSVSGVDPDPVAVRNAQDMGLTVKQGGIEVLDDATEKFDAITLSHVIEHVHDPVGTLERANALLNPDGCLYIETPNIKAAGHKEFKEHWRGLEVPRHLVIFNWDSLERLLRKTGFDRIERVSIRTPYASLAGKSRAIRAGKDPYQSGSVAWADRSRALIRSLASSRGRKDTEFITLYAYKKR